MCAECSRTAQADIAQYLPLLVRDGMTPAMKELVLVSVEDIGHFEPMFCHAVLLPPCAVRDLANGQVVERTRRGVQTGFGDMQVAGGGLEIAMAEQQLNAAQIGAGIEKM